MGKLGTKRIPPENNIAKMLYNLLMSQTELAKKIGMDKTALSRIVMRKVTPGLVNAVKIARELEECVEDVFLIEYE